MSGCLPTDEALEKEDRRDFKKNKTIQSPPNPHLLQAQQAPALISVLLLIALDISDEKPYRLQTTR